MNSRLLKTFFGISAFFALPAMQQPVNAASYTATSHYNLKDSVNVSGRETMLFTLNDATTLYFDKFDASLGTLDSVEFNFSGTHQGTGGVNFSNTHSYTTDSGYSSIHGMTIFSALGLYYTASTSNVVDNTCTDFALNCSTNLNLSDKFVSSGLVMNSPSILENYTGSGSVGVSLELTALVVAYQMAKEDLYTLNIVYALNSMIDASITYHYSETVSTPDATPVPVPAAFWIFATASLGLFGFNRRPKSTNS